MKMLAEGVDPSILDLDPNQPSPSLLSSPPPPPPPPPTPTPPRGSSAWAKLEAEKARAEQAQKSSAWGLEFLERGAGGRGEKVASSSRGKGSSGRAKGLVLPGGKAKVRNFPRLRVEPGGWRRVGPVAEGSLRWFATLPDGLDFGSIQLPPGECLYFATPAWGSLLSRRGGVVTVRVNALWRVEYRIVGNWRAERILKEEKQEEEE
mmetsp:Transcript_71151/g.134044  ORF Transcript_71151/g.134044 Transcript_71151/m.134044 type:complete len:206 (-) Transcript_71151:188-805(-)